MTFDNVKYRPSARATSDADLPLIVSGGAEAAKFAASHGPVAAFTVDPPVFAPGQKVTFTAKASPGAHYTWLFGDGTRRTGDACGIALPMREGTELDGANGAGRFRVLLHVEDRQGHEDWAAQGVVAVAHWHDAIAPLGRTEPGLAWKIYPGTWTRTARSRLRSTPSSQVSRRTCRRMRRALRVCGGVGRVHRYSCRRRLHVSSDGARRRAAGD